MSCGRVQSLGTLREGGDHAGLAACLEGLAATASARGCAERAALLYGRADALRAEHGAPLPPAERPRRDEITAALRAALGDERFRAAYVEGRASPLDCTISPALADVS